MTFQGNCSIYEEEAVGQTDIAQLILYVALRLSPENLIMTLCNLIQQGKKIDVQVSHPATSTQTYRNTGATCMVVLDRVLCDMVVFLHAVVLTQEVWTAVILEANPHPAGGAA